MQLNIISDNVQMMPCFTNEWKNACENQQQQKKLWRNGPCDL